MSDGDKVAKDLKALGVRPGGPLLVHSSIRSLGPLAGGLEGIVSGLLAALDGGTLLMPALSYALIDWTRPVFDLLHTGSCVGALPEFFRTRPGVVRSMHITHSVCGAGEGAADYLSRHQRDRTPCGPNSPFRRLAEANGQILMLGCGLGPNTSMHGVEETAAAPYLFRDGVFGYTAYDGCGKRRHLATRRHGFTGYTQRYDRVAELLDPVGALHTGGVKSARCHLIEAAPLWELCSRRIRRDPWYFVDAV